MVKRVKRVKRVWSFFFVEVRRVGVFFFSKGTGKEEERGTSKV